MHTYKDYTWILRITYIWAEYYVSVVVWGRVFRKPHRFECLVIGRCVPWHGMCGLVKIGVTLLEEVPGSGFWISNALAMPKVYLSPLLSLSAASQAGRVRRIPGIQLFWYMLGQGRGSVSEDQSQDWCLRLSFKLHTCMCMHTHMHIQRFKKNWSF